MFLCTPAPNVVRGRLSFLEKWQKIAKKWTTMQPHFVVC